MSNQLSRGIIKLLFANMSYRVATIILKIFLNIFILKLTWDIKVVAIYSLFTLSFHMIGYTTFSYILKKWFRNISQTFSLLWTAFLLLLLAIFPEIIASHYIIFWMTYGIFSWIYWAVFNNNQFDFTHQKNRWNYEWIKKSCRTWVSLWVPLIIWFLIVSMPQNIWYQISFFIGTLCCLISAYYWRVDESLLVKNIDRFRFRRFLNLSLSYPDIWKFAVINFCISFALSLPLIEVLLPLILHQDWLNEAGIGFFVSLAGGFSIIVSVIFGRYIQYKNYTLSFTLSGILYVLFVLWIVFFQSQVFIYAFMPLIVMLYVFMDIPRSVFSMNIFHSVSGYKKYIWEYILFWELAIIFGRALVFVLLLTLGNLTTVSQSYIFWIMGLAISIAVILFYTLRTDLH